MEGWEIFGHEHVKRVLGRQLLSGSLSHAYLFSGPSGVGKRTLALEFAKKVLQTESLAYHPDFLILDQPEEIKMEQAKDFIDRLSLKPFVAIKKLAIINNAQNFNTQSGNALLKTLEEPSESTVIVLIAEGKNILPTIVSRCQLLSFNQFTKAQISEFAGVKKINLNSQITDLCFGSPGRLLELVNNTEFLEKEQDSIYRWQKFAKSSGAEKFLAILEFGNLEAEELEKMFGTWLKWEARNNPVPKRLSALLASISGLKKNLNKKLILQNLFLSI